MNRANAVLSSKMQTIKPEAYVDVKGARATYGQMVSIGRLIDKHSADSNAGKSDDVEFIKHIIRALHKGVNPAINIPNVRYANEIVNAVHYWKQQEAVRLKYEPTAEEKQAGYERLAELSGASGVASALAEKFSGHPNDIFEWEYGDVFRVLQIDLERYKFAKRLEKIHEDKRKREDRNKRLGRRR